MPKASRLYLPSIVLSFLTLGPIGKTSQGGALTSILASLLVRSVLTNGFFEVSVQRLNLLLRTFYF